MRHEANRYRAREFFGMKLSNNRKGGHWYTNGLDNRYITDENNIPEGFYRGMRYKKGEAHG